MDGRGRWGRDGADGEGSRTVYNSQGEEDKQVRL